MHAAQIEVLRSIARWQAGLDVDDTGSGCLEISWRPAGPA